LGLDIFHRVTLAPIANNSIGEAGYKPKRRNLPWLILNATVLDLPQVCRYFVRHVIVQRA